MPTAWFARKHDIILYYSKSSEWTFNLDAVRVPYKEESLVHYNKKDANGKRYKPPSDGGRKYLHEKGQPCPHVWEIQVIGSRSPEREKYPTQKPLTLYERVVKASSNLWRHRS